MEEETLNPYPNPNPHRNPNPNQMRALGEDANEAVAALLQRRQRRPARRRMSRPRRGQSATSSDETSDETNDVASADSESSEKEDEKGGEKPPLSRSPISPTLAGSPDPSPPPKSIWDQAREERREEMDERRGEGGDGGGGEGRQASEAKKDARPQRPRCRTSWNASRRTVGIDGWIDTQRRQSRSGRREKVASLAAAAAVDSGRFGSRGLNLGNEAKLSEEAKRRAELIARTATPRTRRDALEHGQGLLHDFGRPERCGRRRHQKRAYRKGAVRWHPDKNPNDTRAEAGPRRSGGRSTSTSERRPNVRYTTDTRRA